MNLPVYNVLFTTVQVEVQMKSDVAIILDQKF